MSNPRRFYSGQRVRHMDGREGIVTAVERFELKVMLDIGGFETSIMGYWQPLPSPARLSA